MSDDTIILSNQQIAHKIRRMAYQVYETNVHEKEVVIAGIKENGFLLAKRLKKEVERISSLQVVLCEVSINKKEPTQPVTTSLLISDYENKSLVLVDDVLATGTTLIYGVMHFLEVRLKQFKTAVLVDRNHKKYPVKADFKGISLSTSLNENVAVVFDRNTITAILE
ncbi:MAG: phosphoribosyltransferase family protein [Bacteroidota bacterium]